MSQPLSGKRRALLITGASSGIGRATALHLASRGWRVFAGVRKQQDADALNRESGDNLIPVMLDITDAAAIGRVAEQIDREMGEAGLAGLVNNAGTVVAGPLEILPIDDIRRQFEVNVIAQVAVTQAMLPMIRRGNGRVVNVSSVSAYWAIPFLGPYAASKSAIEAISDSLRGELVKWNIPVVIVAPGRIETPIFAKADAAGDETWKALPEQTRALYASRLRAFRSLAREPVFSPATRVAKVIERALTARRPRTRYRVGKSSLTTWLLGRVLPDRLRDWLVTRAFARQAPSSGQYTEDA